MGNLEETLDKLQAYSVEKLLQFFSKIERNIFKSLEMLFKFSEKQLNFHHMIPTGNVFEISLKISIKFVENFSLFYTKPLKINTYRKCF